MDALRLLLLTAAAAATIASAADGQTLTLVNQGGAPADAERVAVLEPFTKQTGIQIKVDTYNQELAKIRAQIETRNAIWDVLSLNPINERAGCEEGLLEKIDWKTLVDAKEFEAIGGFGECGAPYESMQLIMTGEVEMVYGWQGRVNIANRANKRALRIVWPAGYVNARIYLGILKGSPRKAEAIKLVQYHLTTASQGRFAELMGYPPANSAAYALLSAEKRANLPEKYADRGMMQAGAQYLNFWLDNGDSLRQRFATFTTQ